MRHTISVLVENKFGVLARVSGMFSGRGFNIDSLNVAPTHDASLSRITTVLKGDEAQLDLCIKQLRKLINVVDVIDFKEGQAVARELVLVKVRAEHRHRAGDSSDQGHLPREDRPSRGRLSDHRSSPAMTKNQRAARPARAVRHLELARTGRLALKR